MRVLKYSLLLVLINCFTVFAFFYMNGKSFISTGIPYKVKIEDGYILYPDFSEKLCTSCYTYVTDDPFPVFIYKGNTKYELKGYVKVSVVSENGYRVDIIPRKNGIEKVFVIDEYADVNELKIQLKGISSLRLEKGSLVVKTSQGEEVVFSKPKGYQFIGNKKIPVDVSFRIIDKNTYGFKVGVYDKSKKLYIDPIVYYRNIGGSGVEEPVKLIKSEKGDYYIVGYTSSPDFPEGNTNYHLRMGKNISWDILIIRLSEDLKNIKGVAIIGGSTEEWPRSATIDKEGNIYVCGWTMSKDFPIKGRQFGSYTQRHSKAFVLKIKGDLSEIVRSFRLGGSFYEFAYDIFVDKEGYVYVAGETSSPDFPITKNAYDRTFNGGSIDIFITKFDKDLEEIIASTFVGGKDGDAPLGMYVDDRYVYISGLTWSYDFPTRDKSFDKTFGGIIDGIVIKLNKDLSELVASTYIGGSAPDNAGFIRVDNEGNIYVGGKTSSWDMPYKKDSYKPLISDMRHPDAWLAVFDPLLSKLKGFTYIGGYGDDTISNFIVDKEYVLVGGSTTSYNFPVTVDLRKSKTDKNNYDMFIAEFTRDLRNMNSSIVIGGSKHDLLKFFYKEGDVLILTGLTYSEDLYGNTNIKGPNDIFVMKYKIEKFPLNIVGTLFILILWGLIFGFIYKYVRG